MIQIFGAGIAGSYIYHLLQKAGYEVSIYDKREKPDCRCAWGIAYKEAKELYKLIDLNLDEYVLCKPKYVVANGIWLRNKNIAMFDKKKLLGDLWNFDFNVSNAELKIDATGAARAYLPPVKKDRIVKTFQRLEKHDREENIYIYMSRTGYAWAFPLGDGTWHIGAGDVDESKIPFLVNKLREKYDFAEAEKVCSCHGKIRMVQPSKCKPFIHEGVVGVGEAIGCVSGAGEGNVPSLISARILFECIDRDELENYEPRILSELEWVENEQKFVEAMLKKNFLKALAYLPKIISIERERSVEHSVSDIKKILGL